MVKAFSKSPQFSAQYKDLQQQLPCESPEKHTTKILQEI
jgi:hypothetical protein